MIVLPQSTIQLLIKLLGAVILLGMVEACALAIFGKSLDAPVTLASTALGGLIGLLVQPMESRSGAQPTGPVAPMAATVTATATVAEKDDSQ